MRPSATSPTQNPIPPLPPVLVPLGTLTPRRFTRTQSDTTGSYGNGSCLSADVSPPRSGPAEQHRLGTTTERTQNPSHLTSFQPSAGNRNSGLSIRTNRRSTPLIYARQPIWNRHHHRNRPHGAAHQYAPQRNIQGRDRGDPLIFILPGIVFCFSSRRFTRLHR